MVSVFRRPRKGRRESGQALIEFTLSLPILMLFLAGLIDFGMILFSYSQAANSLRTALRNAEILGYYDGSDPPYLDCDTMVAEASDNYFTSSNDVTITYFEADSAYFAANGSLQSLGNCTTPSDKPEDSTIENGDILHIELQANVDPFFLPIGDLELRFDGQRSIVKAIPVALGGDGGSPGGDGTGDDTDTDGDGIDDTSDNCPAASNPDQADLDGDGTGDACDSDIDGDGVDNGSDNCVLVSNPDQTDEDGDGVGAACDSDDTPAGPGGGDTDTDGDGINDGSDNCPDDPNTDQADFDGDGVGDVCDPDDDRDGIDDTIDNCLWYNNPDQTDLDGDGAGDGCDPDDDGDGINDTSDNCPTVSNPDQANLDGDSAGDACDLDDDGDGINDTSDNCPTVSNPDQADGDGDGIGSACDADEGGSPPAVPTGFNAETVVDCTIDSASTVNVAFDWAWYDPASDEIEIRETAFGGLVHSFDPSQPGGWDWEDTISSVNSRICYYSLATNAYGSSPATSQVCIECIDDPPQPYSFDATCNDGDVSFTWAWSADGTIPEAIQWAEIRRASNDETVAFIADLDETSCPNCLTQELDSSEDYYIITFNGPASDPKESSPLYATAECSAPEPTGSITVCVKYTQGNQCRYSGGASTVRINLYDADDERVGYGFGAGTDGCLAPFSGLTSGNYTVRIDYPDRDVRVHEIGGTCIKNAGSNEYSWEPLGPGENAEITFGLK